MNKSRVLPHVVSSPPGRRQSALLLILVSVALVSQNVSRLLQGTVEEKRFAESEAGGGPTTTTTMATATTPTPIAPTVVSSATNNTSLDSITLHLTNVHRIHTSFDVPELCRLLNSNEQLNLEAGTRLQFVFDHEKARPEKCSNSSLGNAISIHVALRALAHLAGADFSVGSSCAAVYGVDSLQAYLPTFVRAPAGTVANLARARQGCRQCGTNWAHTCQSGWPELAHQIVPGDLRSALLKWFGPQSGGEASDSGDSRSGIGGDKYSGRGIVRRQGADAGEHSPLQATPSFVSMMPSYYDDVAIHLRCGDLFGVRDRGVTAQYGFLHYGHYNRIIPQNVTSIGIICQSLNPNCKEWVTRPSDCKHVQQCIGIIHDLARHLRERYPGAVVTVRDGEPVALSYARLINAPIATICNPSTFCLWPTLASQRGWLPNTRLFPGAPTATKVLPNAEMIPDEPKFLSYAQIQQSRMNWRTITNELARSVR